ncbi:pilin [Francisella philomiragia]|uniref:pilin n=1 Tax=Francisella philomiragia TaxID=28110 RepID=UPI001904DD37|nr:prepilin-type N-terminal cleavage/methylation domain-containing protein [Francisella philomiragia]MBK2257267.1 prepilin-type N-terminal cleavage/methylation domain-containing protein [Francisella philomiragia]MBK2269924.1 prepilin-type N-terminal cleavage/methylation domain-containing protein [Francisella philomiragia]MBK2271730.1 prepilin-type N-terminal cleavage/methylation domain-containing protein [Francisella philomiragia]MBK2275643.1 prepilin-type N-terminal cleavage/methylation domain
MKKKMQKGFSLVELMVVIAIIAILAAVAIPMYSNYTTRAKIGTALAAVGGVKTEVADALANGNNPQTTVTNLPAGVSITSGSTTGATLQLALDNNYALASGATTATLNLAGSSDGTTINWTCTAASGLTSSQLPSNCEVA